MVDATPTTGIRVATTVANIPTGGEGLVVVEFEDPGNEVWLKINGVDSPHRLVDGSQDSITIEELITLPGLTTVEAWTSGQERISSGGGGGSGSLVSAFCEKVQIGGFGPSDTHTLVCPVTNDGSGDGIAFAAIGIGVFDNGTANGPFEVHGIWSIDTVPDINEESGPFFAQLPTSVSSGRNGYFSDQFMCTIPTGNSSISFTAILANVPSTTTFDAVLSLHLNILVFSDPARTADCNAVTGGGG